MFSSDFKPVFQAQQGNVLFLILIAVALFAALSYAVTSSTRSGGGDASQENSAVLAAQLIQQATALQAAVERKKISEGLPDNGFSFRATNNGTATLCSSARCSIYLQYGGDIPEIPIPAAAYDSSSPCSDTSYKGPCNPYPMVGFAQVVNVGSAEPEIMVRYRGLRRDVCVEINKRLGITGDVEPPQDVYGAPHVPYQGNLSAYPATFAVFGDMPETKGQQAFCLRTQNGGPFDGYIYLHTLIAR